MTDLPHANRGLTAGGYLMAIALAVTPSTELAATLRPFSVSEVGWRFGAVGMASQVLSTALVGAFLAVVIAWFLGHARTLRVLGLLNGLGALLLISATILFGLDALEMRARTAIEGRYAFDVASGVALVRLGFGAAITLALSVGAWQAAARGAEEARRGAGRAGVVFGAEDGHPVSGTKSTREGDSLGSR